MSLYDALPAPTLVRAFDVRVDVGAPDDHGETDEGRLRLVPILGGAIIGNGDGEIMPGGGDWQLIRHDGTIQIDATYSARTSSGGLLRIRAKGVRTGSPEVLARLQRGEQVDPSEYYFRTAVSIDSAEPEWEWTQRTLLLASACRQASSVHYRTYRLT